VKLIQAALLTAVQPQPVSAVTETLPVSDPEPWERLVGEIEKVQVGVVPVCVTVRVCPAIVIVPLRELVPELTETE
jgi:hypothetical protein